jgi:hypothetical protein
MDISSAPLWVDYLKFIKSQTTTNLIEESQKMEQMRKLFQRIVVLPLQNLERTYFLAISFFKLLPSFFIYIKCLHYRYLERL